MKERLQRALEVERRPRERQRPPAPEGKHEAIDRFAAVAKAAGELAVEMSAMPEIRFTISSEEVWIDLYDRHLYFGYDPARHVYVADEIDYSWLDRDVREESHSWPEADDCIDAMIRLCARYVMLAQALRREGPAAGGR